MRDYRSLAHTKWDCGARRTTETAAHLVDHVIPRVPLVAYFRLGFLVAQDLESRHCPVFGEWPGTACQETRVGLKISDGRSRSTQIRH
jgi:hypothetical protein